MVGSSELLSRAAKEVQIADHLLTVTFPFAGELKILFRVMAHACNAIDDATQAMGKTALEKVREMPSGSEVINVYKRFSSLLDHHADAPLVFRRKRTYVIVDPDFSELHEVRPKEVEQGMRVVKDFVFSAGKHVLVTP